jgi:hypothetical protein
MLDEVDPASLQSCFDQVVRVLQDNDGLSDFTQLDGRTLIALDGTEYFCSQKLSCDQCLTRKRSQKSKNGSKKEVIESYHSMLCATIVAPGRNVAIPLMPEFIAPQDGQEKQDCERNATKRWLNTHGETVKSLRPIFLGDALFACQPLAEAVQQIDSADFIFVCKPELNKTLYEFVNSSELQSLSIPQPKGVVHTYRWVSGVPLRKDDPINVNWVELTITNKAGTATYRNAFITSLTLDAGNVAQIVACGRCRWKIENESFNVLKNNGYNLEHNFGHGKKNLAQVFACMNLLAFAFHGVCDAIETLWQQARQKNTRKGFFNDIKTLFRYAVFPTWRVLMESIITGDIPAHLWLSADP